MPAITLAQARAQLTSWLNASTAVAKGQSYSIDGVQFSRVNAEHIQKNIDYWSAKVNRLESGRSGAPRVFNVVPRD